jgi:hypothetical protein
VLAVSTCKLDSVVLNEKHCSQLERRNAQAIRDSRAENTDENKTHTAAKMRTANHAMTPRAFPSFNSALNTIFVRSFHAGTVAAGSAAFTQRLEYGTCLY